MIMIDVILVLQFNMYKFLKRNRSKLTTADVNVKPKILKMKTSMEMSIYKKATLTIFYRKTCITFRQIFFYWSN